MYEIYKIFLKVERLIKRLLSNWGIIAIITLLFAVWVFVFDRNSYLNVVELDSRIEELEAERDFYKQKIAEDSAVIVGLKDSAYLEQFARENFYMKRENEKMFIIK